MNIKALQLLSKKKKTGHLLHLILSVITMGFWIPVWAWVALVCGASEHPCSKRFFYG